ncbi:hypothetical protein Emed_002257 [Eimeria media]
MSQEDATPHQNRNFKRTLHQDSFVRPSTEGASTKGVLSRVRSASGDTDHSCGGLLGAGKAAQTVEKAPASATPVQTPTDAHETQQQEQTHKIEWEAKLTLPSLLVPLENTGEMETDDIPCPHFWGAGHQDVGELFSCLQDDSPLPLLPQRDAEVFHLEEAEIISCTGGLEIKDGEFLQSLAEATAFLVEDKAWRSWAASKPQEPSEDTKQLAARNLDALHTGANLGGARLFRPDTFLASEEEGWRFLAPAESICGACMQMSNMVETDLAYCFYQLAAEPDFGDGRNHILPPFVYAPPVRPCGGESLSVGCQVLWRLGGCHLNEHAGRDRGDIQEAKNSSFDTITGCSTDKQAFCEPLCTKDRHNSSKISMPQTSVEMLGVFQQEGRIGADALAIKKEEAFLLAQEESRLRAASLMNESKALEDRCSRLRQEQLKRLRSLNAALPAEFRVT